MITVKSKLYITSTPIGNYDDITLRALETLKKVDFVICEEYKEARRLLSHYGIEKELISMNEHNEGEVAEEILTRLTKENLQAALISDCGTPLFSDPGKLLIKLCIQNEIEIIPLPGANSLITALMGAGLNLDRFYFYGWLSPKKEIRSKELNQLRGTKEVIAIMETPYRLLRLLEDILNVFGPGIQCVLAYELTSPGELFLRGKISEIFKTAQEKHLKGEFVLLVDNSRRN